MSADFYNKNTDFFSETDSSIPMGTLLSLPKLKDLCVTEEIVKEVVDVCEYLELKRSETGLKVLINDSFKSVTMGFTIQFTIGNGQVDDT